MVVAVLVSGMTDWEMHIFLWFICDNFHDVLASDCYRAEGSTSRIPMNISGGCRYALTAGMLSSHPSGFGARALLALSPVIGLFKVFPNII